MTSLFKETMYTNNQNTLDVIQKIESKVKVWWKMIRDRISFQNIVLYWNEISEPKNTFMYIQDTLVEDTINAININTFDIDIIQESIETMVKQSPTAFMYIQDTFVPELNKKNQLIFNNLLEKIRLNQLYGNSMIRKKSRTTKQ